MSPVGSLVRFQWERLTKIFPYVFLGDFIVMPNHLHAVLWLLEKGVQKISSRFSGAEINEKRAMGTESGSLGAVIQKFKSVSTRAVNRVLKSPGICLWQRNDYDRIIRNASEQDAISQYILANPVNWEKVNEYSGIG